MRTIIFVTILLSIIIHSKSVYADKIIINGDRVIIKDSKGKVIDTDNLSKHCKTKNVDNIEINKDGVSIGNITNNGDKPRNIIRHTNLNNVTVISNSGKTTIYNNCVKSSGQLK